MGHKTDRREKIDADEQRLKKTQFQGRVFLALPKSLLAQGLRFSFSEEKRNKNLPKWCFSDPTPRTSKLLSTKTTTRSCCTSHLRSLNTVWNAPGRWNPTKWRGLSTSATKTFRFVDIDGNAIKKQFRYV